MESNQAKWISELVDFHVNSIMNSEVSQTEEGKGGEEGRGGSQTEEGKGREEGREGREGRKGG